MNHLQDDYPETTLTNGSRVPKNDPRIEAYGTIDELNSVIGWLLASVAPPALRDELTAIQHELFETGGLIADANARPDERTEQAAQRLLDTSRQRLATLPALKAFVLPAGTENACRAHICRTVCRRAERCVYTLPATPVTLSVQNYLNRLSCYFFALARFLNYNSGHDEIIFRSHRTLSPEK